MCETCGCGEPGKFKINDPHHSHENENGHQHYDDHLSHEGDKKGHSHTHSHMRDGVLYQHSHEHSHELIHNHEDGKQDETKTVIELNTDILEDNNKIAHINREYLEGKNVLCLNLVSSPGSGKTTILESTIKNLIRTTKIFVIEGDQQTLLDAERIEKSGAPAVQINTGTGCHLDARMVRAALKKIEVANNSVLFIENVGNLVCPAMFDLGEAKRVVVISVTEGEDKPLKYPYMFQSSQLCIINKSDLLPYVDFNTDSLIQLACSINPELEFIVMSAKTGEGMNRWYDWIAEHSRSLNPSVHSHGMS